MTAPYFPVQLAAPIVNPSVGSSGASPIPYISNTVYSFAPTAMDPKNLVPGGTPAQMAQSLADTLLRASRWVDNFCFGMDPSGGGGSLAASLSVESAYVSVRAGGLKLICDYRPIVEVTGIDVGANPAYVQSVGPLVASQARIGRRTIYVPLSSGTLFGRAGDYGNPTPPAAQVQGRLYAVWSYVSGYPHTLLSDNVSAGATSCVVEATNGAGGLWGVYPNVTSLTLYDQASTETVLVTGVTPGTSTATLTTSPFQNAHVVPAAPDFIPVSAIPADVQQAAISMTTMLIKIRGARAMVMPSMPGGMPGRQSLAQAGALEDWDIAAKLLRPYRVLSKTKA